MSWDGKNLISLTSLELNFSYNKIHNIEELKVWYIPNSLSSLKLNLHSNKIVSI